MTDHILARDGVIEKIVLADIDSDRQAEIVVAVRSVGTGGYLSARAIAVGKKKLVLRAAVEGLPPEADPPQQLFGNP